MPNSEQDQHPQDLEDAASDSPFDAEDELDDEDLEEVAGGWSGNDDGGGG